MAGMGGGEKNVGNSILQLFYYFFSYLHQLMLLEEGGERRRKEDKEETGALRAQTSQDQWGVINSAPLKVSILMSWF